MTNPTTCERRRARLGVGESRRDVARDGTVPAVLVMTVGALIVAAGMAGVIWRRD